MARRLSGFHSFLIIPGGDKLLVDVIGLWCNVTGGSKYARCHRFSYRGHATGRTPSSAAPHLLNLLRDLRLRSRSVNTRGGTLKLCLGVCPKRALLSSTLYLTANSFFRVCIWAFRRSMIDECICETRDSDRSSVAPISFIVISS